MIQQVCTIYRKNWGWPCHINNVSPVGQKTAWRICKYLAFVVAVLLSWPAFTSCLSVGLNPSASLSTTTTLPWRANKANFLLHGIALHPSYQKMLCRPGVALFIMFNISPGFTTSREEEEGAKSVSVCCVRIDFHLIPLWAALCDTQHLWTGSSDTKYLNINLRVLKLWSEESRTAIIGPAQGGE